MATDRDAARRSLLGADRDYLVGRLTETFRPADDVQARWLSEAVDAAIYECSHRGSVVSIKLQNCVIRAASVRYRGRFRDSDMMPPDLPSHPFFARVMRSREGLLRPFLRTGVAPDLAEEALSAMLEMMIVTLVRDPVAFESKATLPFLMVCVRNELLRLQNQHHRAGVGRDGLDAVADTCHAADPSFDLEQFAEVEAELSPPVARLYVELISGATWADAVRTSSEVAAVDPEDLLALVVLAARRVTPLRGVLRAADDFPGPMTRWEHVCGFIERNYEIGDLPSHDVRLVAGVLAWVPYKTLAERDAKRRTPGYLRARMSTLRAQHRWIDALADGDLRAAE